MYQNSGTINKINARARNLGINITFCQANHANRKTHFQIQNPILGQTHFNTQLSQPRA
jgi:hypothetical protein